MTQADEPTHADQPARAENPTQHADTTADMHDTGTVHSATTGLDAEQAETLSAGGYGGEQEYPDAHQPMRDGAPDLGSQQRNQTDMTDMTDMSDMSQDAATDVQASDV